jgi:hypothetical protein
MSTQVKQRSGTEAPVAAPQGATPIKIASLLPQQRGVELTLRQDRRLAHHQRVDPEQARVATAGGQVPSAASASHQAACVSLSCASATLEHASAV